MRFPLRYIPPNVVLPVLQGKLRGYRWIAGSSNHGCWLGSYEFEKQRIIGQMVKQGTVAYDVGAHVGFYTLLFSRLTGPTGKVFAFEPFPLNIAYLRHHIALNHLPNVEVMEYAVSNSSGITSFLEGLNSSMGHIDADGNLNVLQVTLDELVKSRSVIPPHYIKMDIEGGEYKALLGAEAMLRAYHPIIFLATHGKEIHQNCCDFLIGLGYILKPITGDNLQTTNEIMAL